MIGRKISDQTITCKVIKPIQTHINSSNFLGLKQTLNQSNHSSYQRPSYHFQTIQQNQPASGRIFGLSSQEIEVDFEFGHQSQNQFNKINNDDYQRTKNTIKQDKLAGSRNVTQYFINTKDKPINIEAKKTINSSKSIPQNTQHKKQSMQIWKKQNDSLKTTKQSRETIKSSNKSMRDNRSKLNQKNPSQAIDKKPQIVRNPTKQKGNQRNMKSATSPNIPKHPVKSNQDTKLKLKSQVDNKKTINNFSVNEKQSVISKEEFKKAPVFGQPSKKENMKKKQDQMSFRAWQETYQQSSMGIQNYSQTQSYEESLTEINKNQYQAQNIKSRRQNQQSDNQIVIENHHQRSVKINQNNTKKPIIPQKKKQKPVQRKYLSVKQQIQEKLKEKREKRKLQLQNSQKLNQLYIKKNTVQNQTFSYQEEDEGSDLDQMEEERTNIPEPITVMKVDNFIYKNQKDNEIDLGKGKEENQRFQEKQLVKSEQKFPLNVLRQLNQPLSNKQKQCQIKNMTDQSEFNEFLEQSQIKKEQEQHMKIMQDENLYINDDLNKQLKYNYVESSDEELNYEQNNIIQMYSEDVQFKKYPSDRSFEEYEDSCPQNKEMHEEQSQEQQSNQQKVNMKSIEKQLSQQLNNPSAKTIDSNKITGKTQNQCSIKDIKNEESEQEDGSQQEEEEQNNPKLQEYLKKRNLLPTGKKEVVKIKKSQWQDSQCKESSQQRINELLKNYSQPQEMIMEVDEQYLQSSIVVKESCSEPFHSADVNAHFYEQTHEDTSSHLELNQYQEDNLCDQQFEDSSDSQNNHPIKLHNPPPFVNNQLSQSPQKHPQLDQIFELNLHSLLNKQYININ